MTTSQNIAEERDRLPLQGIYEALVLAVQGDRLQVRPAVGAGWAACWSRIAVAGYRPLLGDRVLVQRTAASGQLYVIGLVHTAQVPTIAAAGGATASIEGDVIALRNGDGTLLATLDGVRGELTLSSPADLRLSAPHGDVSIEAAGEVTVSAGRKVVHRVGEQQALELTPNGLKLHVEQLTVNAVEAAWAVGHWELRAGRVVEHAEDAFRHVSHLLETRAGRWRTVVAGSIEWLGKRTSIRSEQDTHIDGRRVLLG